MKITKDKLPNLNHLYPAAFMAALALGMTSARAQLIDVNFYSAGFGGSAASGAAVVGTATDQWNGIAADSGFGGPINLVDANGNATFVTLSYNSPSGGAVVSANANIQPNASLMYDYLFNNNGSGITVTLGGLAASTPYDLYIYLASNDGGGSARAANVTANLASGTATGNPETSFINGDNYLLLDVTSSALGTINIAETDALANTSGEVDMNGLQITSVPEPSTLFLFVVGGLGLILSKGSYHSFAHGA
jgi:hypothetical protein